MAKRKDEVKAPVASEEVTGKPFDKVEATAPKEEAKTVKGKLYVPKGKSITTRVGVCDAGTEVTAKMVSGGAEKIVELEKRGLLVKG